MCVEDTCLAYASLAAPAEHLFHPQCTGYVFSATTLCLPRSRNRFDFWPRFAHSNATAATCCNTATVHTVSCCTGPEAILFPSFSKFHDVPRLGLGHADLPGYGIALFQTFLVSYLKRLYFSMTSSQSLLQTLSPFILILATKFRSLANALFIDEKGTRPSGKSKKRSQNVLRY